MEIDPNEETQYKIESSYETTEEILQFNKLFETTDFDKEENIEYFEEKKDEIELESISVFVDINSNTANFANELIKLDIYDPDYNLNLLRLIRDSDVKVMENFYDNLINNIIDNIESIETYDPEINNYFK